MFNLKKHAQSRTQLSYPKQLAKNRDEYKQEAPQEGATERQLKADGQKKKDNTIAFEKQLQAVRTGSPNRIAEGEMNKSPKMFNDKRDDRTHHQPAKSQDLVAEANHQKKLKAFRKARKGDDRDTAFWDKFVGSQMINKPTKIVKNEVNTQLQNTENRFSDLKPELKEKVDGMVLSAMQQADKMLFHIYAMAAKEGRELNTQEKQQITDITSGKARILVAAEKSLKTGQLLPPGTGENINPSQGISQKAKDDEFLAKTIFGPDAARDKGFEDTGAEIVETAGPASSQSVSIKFVGNQAVIMENGEEIDFFPTVDEAKQNYPEATVEGQEISQLDPSEMGGDLQTDLAPAGLGTTENYRPGEEL